MRDNMRQWRERINTLQYLERLYAQPHRGHTCFVGVESSIINPAARALSDRIDMRVAYGIAHRMARSRALYEGVHAFDYL